MIQIEEKHNIPIGDTSTKTPIPESKTPDAATSKEEGWTKVRGNSANKAYVCVLDSKMNFSFTAIYVLHTVGDKESLWQELKQLHSVQQGPWLAMGDFNAVLIVEDRINGSQIQEAEIINFKEFIQDCNMVALRSIGGNIYMVK